VAHIDALFAIGREIGGKIAVERWQVRQQRGRSLVEALGLWLREQQGGPGPRLQPQRPGRSPSISSTTPDSA
jgi:hypothetical protein